MKRKKGIILILVLIAVVGTSSFFTYIHYKTKAWDLCIYPKVSIEGTDLTGKTKKQAEEVISQKYVAALLKNKFDIKTPSKNYTISYADLRGSFNVEEAVNQAFNYGKNLGMFTKYKRIYDAADNDFLLKLSYDHNILKDRVAQIEKETNKDPVNAKLVRAGSGFNIVEGTSGTRIQKDKLIKDIESKLTGDLKHEISIKAPFEEVKPEIFKKDLTSINAQISSFNTDYSGSSSERSNNIRIATNTIDGTVVMPGKSFSFNGILGPRTPKKGYEEAPVIVGTKVNADYGGGICQVSTTLYNAVIRAGVKPTERTHHTMPSHYIGVGMDATVDYQSGTDYKFRNTLKYPIYIEGYTQNGIVGFNIYSNSSLTNTTYNLSSDVYDTIQPQVKYVDDPTLQPGQTQEDQPPCTGYKVKVYLDTYEGGKQTSHALLNDDYYEPVDQVIRRGIQK